MWILLEQQCHQNVKLNKNSKGKHYFCTNTRIPGSEWRSEYLSTLQQPKKSKKESNFEKKLKTTNFVRFFVNLTIFVVYSECDLSLENYLVDDFKYIEMLTYD